MAKRPADGAGKGKEGLVKPPEQPRGWPALATQALRKSEGHGDMDNMDAYIERMKAQEAIIRRGQSQGVHRYDDATTITGAVTSKE